MIFQSYLSEGRTDSEKWATAWGFRGALEGEAKCPRGGAKDRRFQECGRSGLEGVGGWGQEIQRLEESRLSWGALRVPKAP